MSCFPTPRPWCYSFVELNQLCLDNALRLLGYVLVIVASIWGIYIVCHGAVCFWFCLVTVADDLGIAGPCACCKTSQVGRDEVPEIGPLGPKCIQRLSERNLMDILWSA